MGTFKKQLYFNLSYHKGLCAICGSRKMCLSYSVRLVEQPIEASLTRVVSTSHVYYLFTVRNESLRNGRVFCAKYTAKHLISVSYLAYADTLPFLHLRLGSSSTR